MQHIRRSLLGFASLTFTILCYRWLYQSPAYSQWYLEPHLSSDHLLYNVCGNTGSLEEVVLILKTGSSEIYDKLPIHLATTFACTSDYLIYSDLEQSFAQTSIVDALAFTSDQLRIDTSELDQYRALQKHVKAGGNAKELKGEKSWNLDKWKFLPMISDAYARYGRKKKWYLFIEADTYVSLHNLVLWLQRLDYRQAIYAGAQVVIGDTEFAHGGSGFILSANAARSLISTYLANHSHWEDVVARDCCGDKVMAEVLTAAQPSVALTRAFPYIQGETPTSLDWSATHWCKPAVT